MTAKAKVHTVAKGAKGAKPAGHKTTAHQAKTTTSKTTRQHKVAKPSPKHTQTKGTGPAKPRGWARPSDLLPACAAEALAMSLRVAGQRVSDDEVAELHWLAGGDASRPVSIADALAAAARSGLAGCRPRTVNEAGHLAAVGHAAVDDLLGEHVLDHIADDLAVHVPGGGVGEYPQRVNAAQLEPLVDLFGGPLRVHALILGINAPGPHCVLATPRGWWSWGELHSPWDARVEEVVAVSWS